MVVYTDTHTSRTSPQILRTVVDALIGDCHKLYVLEDPYDDFAAYYPHLVSCQNDNKIDIEPRKTLPPKLRTPNTFIGASKPAEIIPFLYLGNERDSADITMLRKLGVTKVLNVSRNCANHFPEYFEYLHVPVEDRVYADISQHFGKALQFIEHARGEGCSILVHCRAGISRSATVIMAYLIQYYGKSMEEAFDFIKLKHPCISPNFNFMGQLLQFQNLHQSKKSEGSTPELWPEVDGDSPCEEEEDEEVEEEEEDSKPCGASHFGASHISVEEYDTVTPHHFLPPCSISTTAPAEPTTTITSHSSHVPLKTFEFTFCE